ncbi:MAG TPA: uroporphyrinogen-III synthase, partial [Longimicrobiales bacterium]|nr:uroporphyrinogen-III synthase [Longimicrobiales bacterium]
MSPAQIDDAGSSDPPGAGPFAAGPLAGRGVVVTRAEGPDGPVSTRLRDRGATPLLRPAVAFDFASQTSALSDVVWRMGDYDWLVLTSSRAVRAMAAVHTFAHPRPERLKVAVVGPGTAAEIETHGWTADLVPESGGASVLVEQLRPKLGDSARILFPASEAASEALPDALRHGGATVDRIDAYAPRPSPQSADMWARDMDEGRIDALTFTSPSAVDALAEALA